MLKSIFDFFSWLKQYLLEVFYSYGFFYFQSQNETLKEVEILKSERARLHWRKISAFVRAGLLNFNDEQSYHALKLGIDLYPEIYLEPIKPNLKAFAEYRRELLPFSEDADKLIANLDKVDFKSLVKYLKCIAENLNETYQNNNKNIYVVTYTGKSEAWILSLIFRFFKFDVKGMIDLSKSSQVYSEQINTSDADVYLLFDDGSYSGSQLRERLDRFYEYVPDGKNIHLTFFYAYMTPKAIQYATQLKAEFLEKYPDKLINFEFNYQRTIPTIDLNQFQSVPENFLKSEFNQRLALVYTDWKRPDDISVFEPFFNGDPTCWQSSNCEEKTAIIPQFEAIYKKKIRKDFLDLFDLISKNESHLYSLARKNNNDYFAKLAYELTILHVNILKLACLCSQSNIPDFGGRLLQLIDNYEKTRSTISDKYRQQASQAVEELKHLLKPK